MAKTYQQFVRHHMLKMSKSSVPQQQKMKMIAGKWRKKHGAKGAGFFSKSKKSSDVASDKGKQTGFFASVKAAASKAGESIKKAAKATGAAAQKGLKELAPVIAPIAASAAELGKQKMLKAIGSAYAGGDEFKLLGRDLAAAAYDIGSAKALAALSGEKPNVKREEFNPLVQESLQRLSSIGRQQMLSAIGNDTNEFVQLGREAADSLYTPVAQSIISRFNLGSSKSAASQDDDMPGGDDSMPGGSGLRFHSKKHRKMRRSMRY